MDHGDVLLRDSKANNLVALLSKTTFTMSPKPLDSFKKGLAKFSKQVKDHKDELNAKLLGRETTSPVDEWLDHEANTVDKRVLDELEVASDYE